MEIINNIGILAYGSLINDPGSEIAPHIIKTISCTTPFNVEYARMSKTRGYAPTLIPVDEGGAQVKASILILDEKISLVEAKNMLWRRETRTSDLTKTYTERGLRRENSVRVKQVKDFEGVGKVIYTSISSNIGICNPGILATLAIKSILSEAGDRGMDGVRYLLNAKNNKIVTPHTEDYIQYILTHCGVNSLEEAIIKLDGQRPNELKKKLEFEVFEKQVKSIADLACEYGFAKTTEGIQLKPIDIPQFLIDNKNSFIKNCNYGFKQAQNMIIEAMLQLEKESDDLKLLQKNLNRKTEKEKYKTVLEALSQIERKEHIFRHIIDTMAWQMIGGGAHISRRLYQGVRGKKRLLKSNIESVIAAANTFNKNEEDFALITDLSSYIQIGDLLMKKNGESLVYVEVKQGAKNHEVFEVVNKIVNSEEPIEKIMKDTNPSPKMAGQIDRNLKQMQEMLNLSSILNTDKGLDKSGKPFQFITPKEEIPRFYNKFAEMYSQLQTSKLFAYDVIENCLHIGIFKGPLKFLDKTVIETMAKQNKDNSNCITVNFLQVIQSLYKPLFMMPFPKEFLFDILFERVSILFVLNIDIFLSLFPNYNMKAEWLSAKETMKVVEKGKGGLFIQNNRCIKVTNNVNGEYIHLGGGTLEKIVFEHIYPSYMAYSCRYYLEELPNG